MNEIKVNLNRVFNFSVNFQYRIILKGEKMRDRSFDRIMFFQNSSVVLSKFVSKEKKRLCEYRHVLYVLSNSVLSKEWYSNKKMLI
jgi:hypothetical protein